MPKTAKYIGDVACLAGSLLEDVTSFLYTDDQSVPCLCGLRLNAVQHPGDLIFVFNEWISELFECLFFKCRTYFSAY